MIPNNNFNQQLPVYEYLPESWEDSRVAIVEGLKKISNAINARPVGWQVDFEIITGKKFIPIDGSQEYREVVRKTIELGALPNNGIKEVAHDISNVDSNFRLLSMWGASTNPTSFESITLPYVAIAGNNVEIKLTNTKIIIKTNFDYSLYTDSVVILEYTTRA